VRGLSVPEFAFHDALMDRPFRLSGRQIVSVVVITCVFLGVALCFRYLVLERPGTSGMCQGEADGAVCTAVRLVIYLFHYSVFGWMGVIAAVLNLLRPSFFTLTIGTIAAACGLVLYNAGLAALAVALLMLSLARLSPGTASMRRQ
jgi:hypothetical protein